MFSIGQKIKEYSTFEKTSYIDGTIIEYFNNQFYVISNVTLNNNEKSNINYLIPFEGIKRDDFSGRLELC